MRIAIYSPYLDTAGGGEKYILTITETLSAKEQVDILLDDHLYAIGENKILQKVNKLHGLDLSKANFIKAPIGKEGNFLKRLKFLRQYDWLFYLTDGSIFFSTAKNNVIHFQVPFTTELKGGSWRSIKKSSWNLAIYNSNFTKDFVEKYWKIKGKVIYPPVSIDLFKPLKKKKQILSVGRFFGYLKDKKHQLLIENFIELVDGGLKGWSLHLAGGAGEGDGEYLEELKSLAGDYEIYFYPNIGLGSLEKLFGESQIYWHALGYGEEDPKKFEHFGITTVEALASGCVPVVVNKGGLREIIEDGVSGYLWDDLSRLKEKTLQIIKEDKLRNEMVQEGIKRSKEFSKEKFIQSIKKIVYG